MGKGELKGFTLRNPGYRVYHSRVADDTITDRAGKGIAIMVRSETCARRMPMRSRDAEEAEAAGRLLHVVCDIMG